MPTTTTLRLATAVEYVRQGRHSADCVCGLYRDHQRAPYCSAEEFRWNEMVNKIITAVLDESKHQVNPATCNDSPLSAG